MKPPADWGEDAELELVDPARNIYVMRKSTPGWWDSVTFEHVDTVANEWIIRGPLPVNQITQTFTIDLGEDDA